MFSGQIGASEDGVGGLTHEEFLEVFSRGNGFTSGCGIEYPENMAVVRDLNGDKNPISGTDYLSGLLRPGRRLLNVRLVRHADGYRRDLQDGESNSNKLVRVTSDFLRLHFYWSFPHPVSDILGPTGSPGYFCSYASRSWCHHSSVPTVDS